MCLHGLINLARSGAAASSTDLYVVPPSAVKAANAVEGIVVSSTMEGVISEAAAKGGKAKREAVARRLKQATR